MQAYVIAEMLGKFVWEVLDYMPVDEFVTWVAYLRIMNEKVKLKNPPGG